LQRRRIEIAAARILEHAIGDAIERVTGAVDRGPDEFRLRGAELGAAGAVERVDHPEVRADFMVCLVVIRITGDDAVVVGRIALRFHQRFLAALRAADEITMAWILAVVRGGDGLARQCGNVDRAMPVVRDLFGSAERETPHAPRRCRGQCRSRRSRSRAQPFLQCRARNVAGETAVADPLEFSVPDGAARQPKLGTDRRIRCRRDRSSRGNATPDRS
jgi:hypothetical protein